MNAADLDRLAALAEAANQGESWWDRWFAPSDELRFIAACDPATVVGLIERIRELEGELNQARLVILAGEDS